MGGLPQNQSRIGWWLQIFRITVFQKALEMVALPLSDPDRAANNSEHYDEIVLPKGANA